MGYIYIIKNSCSPKVYIGQTVRTIERRFYEHLTRDKENKLGEAFDKHGRDNFWVEELEYVLDDTQLSEREIYWINKYDSYKHGYNMTLGGETSSYAVEKCKKPVEKRDKDNYSLIKIFPSLIEAALSVSTNYNEALEHRKNIGACCHKKIHEAYGYRWNFVGEEQDISEKFSKRKKAILMCDKNTGKAIRQFDSAKAASIYLDKTNGSHITACCKGKLPSAYGYRWRYVEGDETTI